MKAVGYRENGPLDRPDALIDVELPDPVPGPADLLVSVSAVAVNPVDTKIRANRPPAGGFGVLGWDAVGTVEAVGPEAVGFVVGGRVFYAGATDRSGCDSAHHVIDHHRPWAPQLEAAGLGQVGLQACLTYTQQHWGSILEVAAPQGRVALIDDPDGPLDTNAMKSKSLSLHWEFMYTRSLHQTPDMAEQGRLRAVMPPRPWHRWRRAVDHSVGSPAGPRDWAVLLLAARMGLRP